MSQQKQQQEQQTASPPSSQLPRPKSTATATTPILGRSATAFELHSHYSHRAVYPTFSSGYAMRQKFVPFRRSQDLTGGGGGGEGTTLIHRPKSSVNFNHMRRSYTAGLIRAPSRRRFDEKAAITPKEEYLLEAEELVLPKRSKFTLIRLAAVYFGIEVLFSLETALAIPILLKLKVPEK